MRENYKAWDLNIEDFYKIQEEEEKLKFLLKFAVLAPSSHNSQPWGFLVKENTVEIYLNEKRAPKHDGNNRQVFISIGCAVENILIAANYYGYKTEVEIIAGSGNRIVNLNFKDKVVKNKEQNHLISYISKRVTNRNRYEGISESNFLNSIKNFETDSSKIFILKDGTKNEIADIALTASVEAMKAKDFRLELSKYVKSNTTRSKIGMPGFGLGIPTPISFIAPIMIKYLNMNKINHKKDNDTLKKNTPVLVVIATKEDDKKRWIETGKIYESIALRAEREGLNTAVWAAPVQIAEFHKDLQKILDTEFRPQIFFRLGQAQKDTPHSPRLCVEEVMI